MESMARGRLIRVAARPDGAEGIGNLELESQPRECAHVGPPHEAIPCGSFPVLASASEFVLGGKSW